MSNSRTVPSARRTGCLFPFDRGIPSASTTSSGMAGLQAPVSTSISTSIERTWSGGSPSNSFFHQSAGFISLTLVITIPMTPIHRPDGAGVSSILRSGPGRVEGLPRALGWAMRGGVTIAPELAVSVRERVERLWQLSGSAGATDRPALEAELEALRGIYRSNRSEFTTDLVTMLRSIAAGLEALAASGDLELQLKRTFGVEHFRPGQ